MSTFCSIVENTPRKVILDSDGGMFEMTGTDSFAYDDVNVSLNKENGCVSVDITGRDTGVRGVIICWEADIPLSARILGDHWERGYGDLEWRGIAPDRVMPWYFLIKSGETVGGIGVKTGANAICSWNVSRDFISLRVDTRNGAEGVLLSGRTLKAASIVTRSGNGESAFVAAKAFCSVMCDNPLMPEKPLYGGNNWYYAYGISTQEKILEDGSFISSLAGSAENRPFMFIDDCWQVLREREYNGGPWDSGNEAFPDMEGLVAAMKNEGVRPGLWIRPLLNKKTFPASYMLPSARFKSKNDCCSGLDCFLDPSIPEVLDIIHEDIRRIAGWGYEMIKHDFTTYDIFGRWGFDMNTNLTNEGWHFYDRSKTSAEIIKNLYAVIRKAASGSMVLGCNTIGHIGAGLFEAQRTGDDTSGIEWARTRKMGVNTLAFRSVQHGTFFAADADCVGITDRVPWELNAQWLDLVANSGTPLFVSIDPAKADNEHKKAIAKSFRTAAEAMPLGEPLDWEDTLCPTEFILCGEKRRFSWGW